MIEVEAKVAIKDYLKARKKIAELGKFVGIEKKSDEYYTLESLDKYPHKSIRIRNKGGHFEINIKKKLSDTDGVNAKQEIEFIIKDRDLFVELIEDFGFRRWLKKVKTTYNYEINKKFHIELNYVKHLGWFLEIEYLAKKKEVPMARRKVLEVLGKLGYCEGEITKTGYTKLLWDKGKRNG
jgi:predicted adenylyl cyclase CyaB